MAIITGTATVPSSSTVAVMSLPPGYSALTLFQGAGFQQVWVGTSPNVAATTGMLVPTTPLITESYSGSKGATLYATTGSAVPSSFSYILSTTG